MCKRASTLKLLSAFEPLASVAIDILGALPKSWCGFQFIIVVADRLSNLVQVVPLKCICSVNVAQEFLKLLIYKYGPSKTTLGDNEKQVTPKSLQSVIHLLEAANVSTSTYHPQSIW